MKNKYDFIVGYSKELNYLLRLLQIFDEAVEIRQWYEGMYLVKTKLTFDQLCHIRDIGLVKPIHVLLEKLEN